MLDSRDPSVIDGFSSVQAVRRSGRPAAGARTRPSRSRLPITDAPPAKPKSEPGKKPSSRIGHTIIPQRHEIVCYECGFAFFLTGRIEKTFCPKCRECLQFEELSIDRRWSGTLKTIGVITISAKGVVTGGTIVATDIILEGAVEGGQVMASRRLEIGPGASPNISHIAMQDIRVRPGAAVTLSGEIVCRDLVVEGELTATLGAAGRIIVEPGGYLKGTIRGAHLIVKDGGGLRANLTIAPDAAPAPPPSPEVPEPATPPSKTTRSGPRKRAPATQRKSPPKNAACKSTRASRNCNSDADS